jgi:hypothetical protein
MLESVVQTCGTSRDIYSRLASFRDRSFRLFSVRESGSSGVWTVGVVGRSCGVVGQAHIRLWLCQDRWHSKFRGSTLSSGLGSSKFCTFRTNTSRATKPIHSRRKLCHPPDHSTNIHMSHSSLNWHSSSSQSQSGTNSCWRPQEKSWTTSCHINVPCC